MKMLVAHIHLFKVHGIKLACGNFDAKVVLHYKLNTNSQRQPRLYGAAPLPASTSSSKISSCSVRLYVLIVSP